MKYVDKKLDYTDNLIMSSSQSEIYQRYNPRLGPRSRLAQQDCGPPPPLPGQAKTSPGCIRFGTTLGVSGYKECPNSANPGCALTDSQTTLPLVSSYTNLQSQIAHPSDPPPAATNSVQEWATGATIGIYNGIEAYYMGMNPYDNKTVHEKTVAPAKPTVNFSPFPLSFAKISTNSSYNSIKLDTSTDGEGQISSGDWVVIYTPSLTTLGGDDSDGPWFLSINYGQYPYDQLADFIFVNASDAGYDGSSAFTGSIAFYVAFQIFSANEPSQGLAIYQGDPFFLWSWGGISDDSPSNDLNGAGFNPGNQQTTQGLVGYTNTTSATSYDVGYGEAGTDLTPWILTFQRQFLSSYPNTGAPPQMGLKGTGSGTAIGQWGCQDTWAGKGVSKDFLYEDASGNYPTNQIPPPYAFVYFVATAIGGCLGYTENGGTSITYGCGPSGCADINTISNYAGTKHLGDSNCGSGCYACQNKNCSLIPIDGSFTGTTYSDSNCDNVPCITYNCTNGSCGSVNDSSGTYTTSTNCNNECGKTFGCANGSCQVVDGTFTGTTYPSDSTCGGACTAKYDYDCVGGECKMTAGGQYIKDPTCGGGCNGNGNDNGNDNGAPAGGGGENVILYAGIGVGILVVLIIIFMVMRR